MSRSVARVASFRLYFFILALVLSFLQLGAELIRLLPFIRILAPDVIISFIKHSGFAADCLRFVHKRENTRWGLETRHYVDAFPRQAGTSVEFG